MRAPLSRTAFALVTTALFASAAVVGSGPAQARRVVDRSNHSGVPYLDVKGSCQDAQKFSTGDDKNTAYKGCIQDEMSAKSTLEKRWSSYNAKDRQNCFEQARAPSPSYVEVLTCIEMYSDAIANAPKGNGNPQIGGPTAPGLPTPSPAPASTVAPRT